MHEIQLEMGAHFLSARHRRLPSVAIVAAVDKPTRELLIAFNEGSHRGIQFSVCGSEGGTGLGQFSQ